MIIEGHVELTTGATAGIDEAELVATAIKNIHIAGCLSVLDQCLTVVGSSWVYTGSGIEIEGTLKSILNTPILINVPWLFLNTI